METLYLSKQVCVSFELIITTLLNYYYHAINLVINFLNISGVIYSIKVRNSFMQDISEDSG